ncbi:MAG: iron ABC transporter permease [Nitrospirae bacterium 13_2_20CM_2_62_8]|nr:MAG: iron ABC transporter permease [Nitrospirae bacterium 13_2_20CM_62_7]OLB56722.1 MAG: iron ABC transporter permease [Nitrospirae bacterium 13_2_20CM_2_62_8]
MTTAVRQTVPPSISVVALGVAGVICAPLMYIVYLALSADSSVWSRLWNTRIPELLFNTVSLAVSVSAGTFVLGVSLAWLVVRYNFLGRQVWEWALVLPLAMPTYVLAYVYTYLLGAGGPVEQAWQIWAGPEGRVFSPHSYAGATLVMTLDTFPFVYLLTRAALLNFNLSYEEVARVCGASRLRRMLTVTLPLLRPAIVAGLSLVILYVVSDFGAVSLLRFQTFTYAVYQQITGRYDQTAAGVLSLLLVLFALIFLVIERWFRERSRFYQTTGRYRVPARKPCGPLGTGLITLYMVVVFGIAFGLPALLLIHWSVSAVAEGAVDVRFLGFMRNSVFLSGLAATFALLIGTPLAYLASRWPSRLNVLCLQAAYAGYVLPGPVGALALLVLFSHLAPFWYGTAVVLIVAYIVHFLPAGLQTMEPALQQVTPNLEEAARSLGLGPVRTFRETTLPLVQGGFVAAWVLMFLQCMKELPATLLLRPVGFDTLAVRVWLEASEEYYKLAAPSALLIVIMTLPALLLLVSKDWRAA